MYFVESCVKWISSLAIAWCAVMLVSGCGGVSAPSAEGPAFNGDTGFTTAASTQIWQKTFGPTASTSLDAVAADSAGNVIAGGWTYGAFPGSTNSANSQQAYVAKFDPSGNPIWAQQLGAGSQNAFLSIAADANGNIYVAGVTNGVFPGTTNTGAAISSIVIAKFAGDGQMLWLQQYPYAVFVSIAVTPDSNLVLAGGLAGSPGTNTTAGTFSGSFVWKLNGGNGAVLWQQQLAAFAEPEITAVAADSPGNVFAAGIDANANANGIQPLVVKLNGTDGSLLWKQSLQSTAHASGTFLTGLAVDAQNNPVITGENTAANTPTEDTASPGCLIAKLDGQTGAELWLTLFGTPVGTSTGAAVVNTQGDIFVTGMTSAALLPAFTALTDDVYLAKFNAGGDNVWLQQYSDGNNPTSYIVFPTGLSFPPAMTAGAIGSVYVGEASPRTVSPGSGNTIGFSAVPVLAKFGP